MLIVTRTADQDLKDGLTFDGGIHVTFCTGYRDMVEVLVEVPAGVFVTPAEDYQGEEHKADYDIGMPHQVKMKRTPRTRYSSFMIGHDITIHCLNWMTDYGSQIRVGIEAPRTVNVVRDELLLRDSKRQKMTVTYRPELKAVS